MNLCLLPLIFNIFFTAVSRGKYQRLIYLYKALGWQTVNRLYMPRIRLKSKEIFLENNL